MILSPPRIWHPAYWGGSCRSAALLCGGVVEFPGDFRQFLEGMEIVAVYSQFGNMEMLIGVECQLKVEQDRFAVCEKGNRFSDDVLTGYFQFPFQ